MDAFHLAYFEFDFCHVNKMNVSEQLLMLSLNLVATQEPPSGAMTGSRRRHPSRTPERGRRCTLPGSQRTHLP